MSGGRWQHKVVEIPYQLFGAKMSERVQAELDKWGAQGWQLVSVVQPAAAASLQLFLKREG